MTMAMRRHTLSHAEEDDRDEIQNHLTSQLQDDGLGRRRAAICENIQDSDGKLEYKECRLNDT